MAEKKLLRDLPHGTLFARKNSYLLFRKNANKVDGKESCYVVGDISHSGYVSLYSILDLWDSGTDKKRMIEETEEIYPIMFPFPEGTEEGTVE